MTSRQMPEPLRVGMVGYAFMGAAHSQAWRTAPRFFDLPLRPRWPPSAAANATAAGGGRGPARLAVGRDRLARAVARDDIDLVDICTPGDTHAEIAIAALEAGKHVLCEKPLANTRRGGRGDGRGGRRRPRQRASASMVGFNYRRVPAIALARRLVAEGRIGEIRHVRAQYLQDWIVDPQAPLIWRLRKDKAGSGALGDIGAHIIDLAQYITGERSPGQRADRDVRQGAPAARRARAGLSGTGGQPRWARSPSTTRRCSSPASSGGGLATFEATRFATGRKNAIRIEINGSRGLAWPSTSRT